MKGSNLGEFEEVVLLTTASLLNDAYSVAITESLSEHTGRSIKLGVVHSVLHRLEKKGFVISQLGEPTKKRGGRRKRYYTITNSGKAALNETRELRERIWKTIPSASFDLNFNLK